MKPAIFHKAAMTELAEATACMMRGAKDFQDLCSAETTGILLSELV